METHDQKVFSDIKRRELKICLWDVDKKAPMGPVWTIPVKYDEQNEIWAANNTELNLNIFNLRINKSLKLRSSKVSLCIECCVHFFNQNTNKMIEFLAGFTQLTLEELLKESKHERKLSSGNIGGMAKV